MRLWANRLDSPAYETWFARWQASDPSHDATIRAALDHRAPPFLVVVADGEAGARTRGSLAAQVAGRWIAISAESITDTDGNAGEALLHCAACGGYLLRLEGGERLARHAIAVLGNAACQGARPLVLYADEDVQDDTGIHRDPWFKVAFDPDRLLQQGFAGCAVAYDAALLVRHGLSSLRGHALALAATHRVNGEPAADRAIHHVPAVLVHRPGQSAPWRSATDANAVAAALDAAGEGAVIQGDGTERPLRIAWPLRKPAPLVSIIIPTRDKSELLRPCLDGLLLRTSYPEFEVLVVDNDSTEPALHALLDRYSTDPRLRVLRHGGAFNYSAINNRAAAAARGEVLLLLNNDTEVLHADWLSEMVSQAIRAGVGAVGARAAFRAWARAARGRGDRHGGRGGARVPVPAQRGVRTPRRPPGRSDCLGGHRCLPGSPARYVLRGRWVRRGEIAHRLQRRRFLPETQARRLPELLSRLTRSFCTRRVQAAAATALRRSGPDGRASVPRCSRHGASIISTIRTSARPCPSKRRFRSWLNRHARSRPG